MLVNRQVWGVNMNPRRNRRFLILVMYLFIGFLFWLEIQRRFSGWTLFLVILAVINPLIFGDFMFWGKKYGGLLKPFHRDSERPNDERELAARDAAHFSAHTTVELLLLTILILPEWLPARLLENASPPQLLFYTRTSLWGLLAVSMTLPQAILLWREPDIESEPEEKNSLAIPPHLR
jgi:hypothetical protein